MGNRLVHVGAKSCRKAPPLWGLARGPGLLTELACRNARPGEKDRKLADAHGLYLLVKRTGYRTWCWKYRHAGRERKLTIGAYPEISLKQARDERDEARRQLRMGLDPAAEKKRRKAEAAAAALDSFERVARGWHAAWSASRAPRYARQVLDRLEGDVFPRLGRLPVREITPPMVLDAIRSIEKRGAREMAHRVRMHISDVFVWAIASGLAEQDPAAVIRKALKPTNGRLRPAVLKLRDAREVLRKAEAQQDAWWATHLASRLLALTAARPGVVRLAERSEFEGIDGDSPLWRIPADKMKLTQERKRDLSFEFVLPLSSQAVAVVRTAMQASPGDRWLFPGMAGWRKPISDSTLSKHYRLAGFTGRHVPHGWRATFSTIMNERAARDDRGGDRAVIELMLAHVQDGVEAAYNRAAYMPRRRELAQAWADMLMEGLPPPETLLPPALRP